MRQHEVIWTCDRCNVIERVHSKSDSHFPDGWGRLEHLRPVDLCDSCMGTWKVRFGDFHYQFMEGLKPQHPLPEQHTVIDDQLSELDPETMPQ